MENTNQKLRNAVGYGAVFSSALCFYLTTLIIKWSAAYVEISSAYFVFARLFLGLVVVSITMSLLRQRLHAVKYHYLIGRAVANCIAVYCFYKAVEIGTVAEANILNMTYPLFVTIFSWFFLKEQRSVSAICIVIVACIGVWLVLSPGETVIRFASVWGLCSGITAAAAILYLNISRRYHDSQTILFFMFSIGSLVVFFAFQDSIFWPNLQELFFLFICSAAGVLGQYLITYGFFYVTAVEGSIISSSRILFAALLGPLLVAEPPLTLIGGIGAFLIFAANTAIALRTQHRD